METMYEVIFNENNEIDFVKVDSEGEEEHE